jgi:phosphoglycolate phosphatase
VDAIIFDLDGTLWDSAEICARAWNHALAGQGVSYREILRQDIAGIMGLTSDEVRAKLFPDFDREKGTRLLHDCFESEVEHLLRHGGSLYPFVAEGLGLLARKYPLFLVSNCDGPYLDTFFATSGLKAHFRDWECHGNTGLSKAENIRKVVERNSLGAAVYVGDTLGDQNAARSAGVPFAFVEYGFGRCTDFNFRFATFRELVEKFG